jgi:hypothetical protein
VSLCDCVYFHLSLVHLNGYTLLSLTKVIYNEKLRKHPSPQVVCTSVLKNALLMFRLLSISRFHHGTEKIVEISHMESTPP